MARETIFSVMKNWYMYKKYVDWVECNISGNNHITQGVWPSNCFVIAYVAIAQKVWRPWWKRIIVEELIVANCLEKKNLGSAVNTVYEYLTVNNTLWQLATCS